MFALRKITGEGVELNFRLGGKYTVVRAETSPENFKREFTAYYDVNKDTIFHSEREDITGDMEYDKKHFWLDFPKVYEDGFKYIFAGTNLYKIDGPDTVLDAKLFDDGMEGKTYAFVANEDGSEIYPLFRNQRNYIVGENGKTFSNLTLK
jgi:hypothetical protein